MLKEILDSFGLIVCGWSAQWDSALRAAIDRCPSRRFTTYWASRGKLTDEAGDLVRQRRAEVVSIEDADVFFGRLTELVFALKDSRRQHPASVEAAVAITKRYLADARHRIELDEFVRDQTEIAHERIEAYGKEMVESRPSCDVRFKMYRDILERLQHVMIVGIAYGSSQQDSLWVRAVQRVAGSERRDGVTLREGIRHYPIAYLLYSAGMVAVSRKRFETLEVVS